MNEYDVLYVQLWYEKVKSLKVHPKINNRFSNSYMIKSKNECKINKRENYNKLLLKDNTGRESLQLFIYCAFGCGFKVYLGPMKSSAFHVSKRLFVVSTRWSHCYHILKQNLPQDGTISCCYVLLLRVVTWPLQPQFEFEQAQSKVNWKPCTEQSEYTNTQIAILKK